MFLIAMYRIFHVTTDILLYRNLIVNLIITFTSTKISMDTNKRKLSIETY